MNEEINLRKLYDPEFEQLPLILPSEFMKVFRDLGVRACREIDPELFFSEKRTEGETAAKAICKKCVITNSCLEYSMSPEANAQYKIAGIWGGLNVHERKELVRKNKLPKMSY